MVSNEMKWRAGGYCIELLSGLIVRAGMDGRRIDRRMTLMLGLVRTLPTVRVELICGYRDLYKHQLI